MNVCNCSQATHLPQLQIWVSTGQQPRDCLCSAGPQSTHIALVQAIVRLPQADCRRLAAAAQEPSQDEIDLTTADEVHPD